MRRKTAQQHLIALTVVAGILLAAAQPCLARYTWDGDGGSYVDITGDATWSRPYVEAMRQAKVVVGYKYEVERCRMTNWGWQCWTETYWKYKPMDSATRAWWGMCLMEVLGTLEDYSYRIGNTDWWWDGRRWFRPYANDMLAMGLIPYQTFQDGSIRRDEAFSWSVRALGLRPVAESMSESEINYWLNKFWDGQRTAPQYRADMALCIKLGLAKGRGDGLYPADYLKRSEGAALASRLLSVLVHASPQVFRPRMGEVVALSLSNKGVGTLRKWKVEIWPESSPGTAVQSWSGDGLPGSPWYWNGNDKWGNPCSTGRYFVYLDGNYASPTGETIQTLGYRFIVLDGRFLDGAPFRDTVVAGAPVYVKVWGSGTAKSGPQVTASWGSSGQLSWNGSYGEGVLSLPASVAEGTYRLDFSAVLGAAGLPDAPFSVSRTVTVVQERVSLSVPGCFAPGRGEVLPVRASARGYTSPVSWRLRIYNASGALVREYSGSGLPSNLCSWDGRDASGKPCPGGSYTLVLEAVMRADTGPGKPPYDLTCTASAQTVLDCRVMDASVEPTRTVEESPVTVRAQARDWTGAAGQFADARVLPSWGGEVVLSGSASERSGQVTPPRGATGTQTLTVKGVLQQAGLPDVTLTRSLSITVDQERRSITAWPAKNQVVAGAVVYVYAKTAGDVVEGPVVEAWGNTVRMTQTGGGSGWEKTWQAVVPVPATAADGRAIIVAKARLGQEYAQPKWFQAAFDVQVVHERAVLDAPSSFAPARGELLTVRCSWAGYTTGAGWTLAVRNAAGTAVRQFSGTGSPEVLCVWDGRDASGNLVPPGRYVLELVAQRLVDTGPGNPPYTIEVRDSRSVIVDGRRLIDAWPEVSRTVAGAPLYVRASYEGQLVSASAQGSWGSRGTLSEVQRGLAVGQVPVPFLPDNQVGSVTVSVTLRQEGLPDLTLSKTFRIEIVCERITVSVPAEVSPRAGQYLLVKTAYRGYTKPYGYELYVESQDSGWARVWSVSGSGLPSVLPPWDGKVAGGRWADPGTYRVRLVVWTDADVGPGRPPYRLRLEGTCPFVVLGTMTYEEPGKWKVIIIR